MNFDLFLCSPSRYIAECHRERAYYEKTKLDSRPREAAELGHSIHSQVLEARSRREIGTLDYGAAAHQFVRFISSLTFSSLNFQFLYVNQTFAPSPDQTIKNLYECYATNGKLILYYCKSQAWGWWEHHIFANQFYSIGCNAAIICIINQMFHFIRWRNLINKVI